MPSNGHCRASTWDLTGNHPHIVEDLRHPRCWDLFYRPYSSLACENPMLLLPHRNLPRTPENPNTAKTPHFFPTVLLVKLLKAPLMLPSSFHSPLLPCL